MKLKVVYCIGALLLLFTCTINAKDTSFKAKFGEEFGTDLKKYHAEMYHSDMDRFEELIKSLLSDTEPSPAEEQRFKSYLETVKEIKAQIGESVDIELIKKLKSFGKNVIPDLLVYRSAYRNNGKDKQVIENIFERSAECEKKDAKVAKEKIYKKFHEMYKKIPAEELEKYDEYTEIDKLMENVANRSAEESGTLENLLEYISLFRKLGEFFEYPEYKEIFA